MGLFDLIFGNTNNLSSAEKFEIKLEKEVEKAINNARRGNEMPAMIEALSRYLAPDYSLGISYKEQMDICTKVGDKLKEKHFSPRF